MELRMYGLVNYQLTGIQKGIQFLHGVVEYGQFIKNVGGEELLKYNEWADKYKTVILLDGGTTNTNPIRLGTLNQHLQTLKDNNIFYTDFYEPDLGDQLTGVVFIVDERVFQKDENRKYVYLDFEDWVFENPNPYISTLNRTDKWIIKSLRENTKKTDPDYYNKWVEYMGGEKNIFLRDFLKDFRLA
jgi:hypothetical protein